MPSNGRLFRSESDRVIGGVCAGLGRYLAVDPVLVRLAFVVLALVNGVGAVIYLILWIVLPGESSLELSGDALMRANVSDMRAQAGRLVGALRNRQQGALVIGVALVAVGVVFLLGNFVPWLTPGLLWPIVLIALGAYLLFSRRG